MEDNNLNTIAQESHMDKHGHKYWALVLTLMGLCLAAVMYFVYKNSADKYIPAPPMVQGSTPAQEAPESSESSGSVEEDQTKTTPEVTNDLIIELEDIQNSDTSASFESSQMSDLE